MKKLENETVFIIGGLSGIWKICALTIAEEDANITIADLNDLFKAKTIILKHE
jgi:NAD(P)-dependent dehydrogenase (short-subunit alcohol dehydrogenase family)